MIALTRDFHVGASSIAARFSAVFVSICYNAKTRYVCAHFHLLIRHYNSVLPSRVYLSELLRHCDSWIGAVSCFAQGSFEGSAPGAQFSAATSSRVIACSSPNVALPLSPCVTRL